MVKMPESRGNNSYGATSTGENDQEITVISGTKYKTTPLPSTQIMVLSIVVVSEPLSSSILFPFIYFMVRDFHLSDDEKDIGSYAGWIASVFFLAQFLFVTVWGRVSDRIGRRPVLLIGLVGNIVSCSLFGMSKTIGWAIGSRALCGIMNGNTGVGRCMIGEMTDTTNRAKAFSLWGLSWGVGSIGPAIGGYFYNPVKSLPYFFGDSHFFLEYPYALPCFIASILSSISFMIGYLFLKETHPGIVKSRRTKETDSILSKEDGEDDNIQSSYRDITLPSVLIIGCYSIFAFYSLLMEEVLPLYFTAPFYAGGLNITPQKFAEVLTIMGAIQLLTLYYVYPKVAHHYPILSLVRCAFMLFIPVFVLLPELVQWNKWIQLNIEDDNVRYWVFKCSYFSILFTRTIGTCFVYTSLGIMLVTSASSKLLSKVSSLCQCCLSLVRAFAPTVGGSLWSYSLKANLPYPFDYHLVFYIVFILCLINIIQIRYVPYSVSIGGSV